MINRNIKLAILIILTLLIQACSTTGRNVFFQAYDDKNLKKSEIAWIFLDNPKIQIFFEKLNSGSKKYFTSNYSNHAAIALPAGVHEFEVRYYDYGYITKFTAWNVLEKKFEGGKCYKISCKGNRDKTKYFFKVEDMQQCDIKFQDASSSELELWRIAGPTANPKFTHIKSYKVKDNIFSSLRETNNNATITTIPLEFIRELYEELE